jgi:hypothetical protein
MRSLFVMMVLAVSTPALAVEVTTIDSDGLRGEVGVGVQVGEPFMVTAKYWPSERTALQLGVGSFGHTFGPVVTADFLLEFLRIGRHSEGLTLGFHAGLGGGIGFGSNHCYRSVWGDERCNADATLAMRLPLGANVYFGDTLELFAEAVPTIGFLPGVYGGWGGGVGGRIYF